MRRKYILVTTTNFFNASLRSKRSRTKRTKFGPPKESFGPREKWGQSKKVEGRGWGRGKQMGVFQNLGVCGQAFPSFPSPTPFLPPFCSRPIFRGSRMRKTDTRCPNFVCFVRERLLRRLVVRRPTQKTCLFFTF